MKFAVGIALSALGTALFAALAVLFRKAKKKPFDFMTEAWEILCLAAVLLALGIVFIGKYR